MNIHPKEQWVPLNPDDAAMVAGMYKIACKQLTAQGFLGRADGPIAFNVTIGELPHFGVCLSCRCSELRACEGGCGWAIPNLCTLCMNKIAAGVPL